MAALDPSVLSDISALRRLNNSELQALGRIPYPFLYQKGDKGFKRISWEEAITLAGKQLSQTPGARQSWFATSRGITNETYYAFTKAARLAGTHNIDLCARLCHQASVAGLKSTIGVGAPTVSLKDLIGTDLLVLWGTDIANNQPVSMKYLAHAKEQGTRIVVINPVREKGLEAYWIPSMPLSALFGTKLADDQVSVKIGGDLALINGILKALIESDRLNHAFIREHTVGFEALEAMVRGLKWEELCTVSGVSQKEILWLAELFSRARTAISIWSMGITQHSFGTENVQGICNLHLCLGLIGQEKSGLVPIRGHSGVQGGAECGVGPTILPGGVPCNAEQRARFEQFWGHRLSETPGLSTLSMVSAMLRGEIDFLYNLGGNLHAVLPDPEGLKTAYSKVNLRIHQDIVFNTSTVLEPGETILVLPAQTRYEQKGGGTSTSTERRIRFSPEIPKHPVMGESRPEYEIPCQLVSAAFPEKAAALSYSGSAAIREEIAQCMPMYSGIETLKAAGDSVQWGGPILCKDGIFTNMPDQKARFTPVAPKKIEIPEGHLYLTTRRGKQFNSIILHEKDRLHGGSSRMDVFISAAEAAKRGIKEGDKARIGNQLGQFIGVMRLMDIQEGAVQAYWPECNVVIPTRCDPLSEEPDYHAVVWVEKT
jgi:molybdopterin-dependent oxidoreductase alpha subunit